MTSRESLGCMPKWPRSTEWRSLVSKKHFVLSLLQKVAPRNGTNWFRTKCVEAAAPSVHDPISGGILHGIEAVDSQYRAARRFYEDLFLLGTGPPSLTQSSGFLPLSLGTGFFLIEPFVSEIEPDERLANNFDQKS